MINGIFDNDISKKHPELIEPFREAANALKAQDIKYKDRFDERDNLQNQTDTLYSTIRTAPFEDSHKVLGLEGPRDEKAI